MAQQLKKKFIKSDAVDGSKLKLLKDQAIRGEDQSGQEVELLKLDQSGKLVSQGAEVAFKSQIDAEEVARIAGDSALDARVSVNESDIEALDTALGEESTARLALESVEQSHYIESRDRLNVVESDISGLESRIENEENFRSNQIDFVLGKVEEEKSRAMAAEDMLQSSVNNEQSRAMGEESRIESLVNAEVLRAQSAEMQLSSDISVERQARIDGDASTLADSKSYTDGKISLVMSNLDTEALDSLAEVVSAFQAADSNLNDAISALGTGSSSGLAAEIARAQGEEARIEGKVDDERVRAMAAESALQSSLNTEISNRQAAVSSEASTRASADSALQSSLNTEISNRQSAVSAEETARIAGDAALQVSIDDVDGYAQDVRNDLDQEILDRASAVSTEQAARIAGDNSLQSSLNSEISSRQSGDNALQSSLNSEISRAQSAESGLSSRIGVLEQDPTTKTYVDGKVSLIEGQISNIISNVDPAALDSLSEIVSAFQSADSDLTSAISSLGTSSSSALAAEVSRAQGVESGLDSRIQVLEAQVDGPFFDDEMFEMSSASQMEYVELSKEAIEKSMVVCVGHLMLHRNFHYTVSVVGGKTKITFINDFAAGGVEEMDSTDIVFVKYAYEM